MSKKQKQAIEKLANKLKQCEVSNQVNETAEAKTDNLDTILSNVLNPELLAKWPKLQLHKVPPIFLHKPTDFEQHVRKVLSQGVKFYQPLLGKNYTKICCVSFNDHKYLLQYLDKMKLPYHTFGNPSKRKMKVVIRGLPNSCDLKKVKEVLKSLSIPVIRVHKMQLKEERRDNTMLMLAVVPYDEQGKAILRVTKLLGHDVKLEPPINKPSQCFRCQKWGHSQRYCHSTIKCVKCGGGHLSKKCEKKPETPPKCANCEDEHTANSPCCIFAPQSEMYKMMQELRLRPPCIKPRQIVTTDNLVGLFKNVDYEN